MKKGILFSSLLFPFLSFATNWQVGPSRTYKNPSEVAPLVGTGDTVEIDAAIYLGDVCSWTKDSLVLKGIGGRPHLRANGNYALGKGTWVFVGNAITVENIEFSEASVPDQNGAGIRLDGKGIIVRNCYFHNNENGILTGNNGGTIRIDDSEFGYNGFGDGFSHNIYIGRVDTAIIRFSYFHHANVGHELKSRARVNYIFYNRFSNESTGNASREIDLPNGGISIILGNIVHQGPNSLNGNIMGYGLEGLVNAAPHELYAINNTMVNERFAGSFIAANDNTVFIKLYNNIFAGPGTPLLYGGSNTVDSTANFIFTTIAEAKFVNPAIYDYHLSNSSPAINGGTSAGISLGGINLTPEFEYIHPVTFMTKSIQGTIDAGSYELTAPLPAKLLSFTAILRQQKIVLEWKTVNEVNILSYDLLRSKNGINFEKIGSIAPQQKNVNNYQWTDNVSTGAWFYQIKAIDQDGSAQYSKIVSAIIKEKTLLQPKALLQNSILYVHNLPKSLRNCTGTIQLFNTAGVLVCKKQITFPSAETVTIHQPPTISVAGQLILHIQSGANSMSILVQ